MWHARPTSTARRDVLGYSGDARNVHAILQQALRHRDPPSDLLHQRDRIDQRPLPARGGARGHFPTEMAALKCLYLVTRSLDPTGRGKARWATRWKPALNAFAITFEGRITPTGN